MLQKKLFNNKAHTVNDELDEHKWKVSNSNGTTPLPYFFFATFFFSNRQNDHQSFNAF